MAKLKDDMKELNDALKGRKQNLADIEKLEAKGYKSAVDRKKIEQDILKIKQSVNNLEADQVSLGKQINGLDSVKKSKMGKLFGIEKKINIAKESQKSADKKQIKQQSISLDLTKRVLRGEADVEDILREKNKLSGKFLEDAEELEKILKNYPNLSEKLKLEAQAQDKIDGFRDKIKETSAFLSSPKAMGVAVIGLLVQQMVDFAQKALEVRQSLGVSAVESARIAGNMKLAGMNAKRFGGSVEQAEAAVTSMASEFGSIDVISASVSAGLGRITGQFGLSGDNAGKLLKTMQGINGASIETNLATLETVGNLARASRVAPAAVLNDMAESTETFAKFSMEGGDNLAKAAIAARKLGLNLSTVDKIAESIMDIEGSIANEMEASMLLGRQLSLDRARQLVMEGDMAGMLEEVKRQAGGAAEFAKLDFVQRKSLAAAVGLEASELAKLAAGEDKVAELEEKRSKNLAKNMLMGAAAGAGILAIAMALKAVFTGGASLITDGIAAAGGAAMGMGIGATVGAGVGAIASMEKGGVVKKGGMAVVHKGEAFSGTRNEMGMGNGETNRLLKDLIKQNEFLMNRLTNRVGDIALSN